MLVCFDPEFVCILPAHTASTSLHGALTSLYPVQDIEPHHYVAPDYFKSYQHFLTITSVRNPYTRLISHYRHSCDINRIPTELKNDPIRLQRTRDARELGFEAYCKRYAYLMEPITKILNGITVQHIVRQEFFERDLRALPLPRINRAKLYKRNLKPKINWLDVYRRYPAMVDWVKQQYETDFIAFSYNSELPL